MLSNVKNIFKVEDLRNKVLFTLAMIAVYRFGSALRVPGVDAQAVRQLREASNSQGALGFLNLFSGGAFGSFSIFALGIMPYITASIIMQVLGRGKITKAVSVSAHAVSKTAEQAIIAAGGSVTILPMPHKGPRPAAKGNQFTNR